MTRVGTLLLLLGLAAAWSAAEALELDRRRMLNAEEHVPWRGVGRVNVATDISESMCTGTLIAEDLVLTAAHCVINPLTGKPYRAEAVEFVAGWRLGQKVAARAAEAIAVHPDFRLRTRPGAEDIATDLALVRLAAPIPRAAAPPFEIAPAPGDGTALTLISYRQDRPHALTRQQGCDILDVQGSGMTLACDVIFGASGSPLFVVEDDAARIVAVVVARGEAGPVALAFAVLADAALPKVMAGLR